MFEKAYKEGIRKIRTEDLDSPSWQLSCTCTLRTRHNYETVKKKNLESENVNRKKVKKKIKVETKTTASFLGLGFGLGVYALRLSHSATPSEQKLELYARELSLTPKLTNPKTHALNTETTMALGFPIGN